MARPTAALTFGRPSCWPVQQRTETACARSLLPGAAHVAARVAAQGIECMRASCKLAAQVLQHAGTLVKPGVTTEDIDLAVHDMVVAAGAYPSPLNYGNFPKSVCTSVNEVMCHGIPDKR